MSVPKKFGTFPGERFCASAGMGHGKNDSDSQNPILKGLFHKADEAAEA